MHNIYILLTVYWEVSRVCCRIVTSAAGKSDNTATIRQQTSDTFQYTVSKPKAIETCLDIYVKIT